MASEPIQFDAYVRRARKPLDFDGGGGESGGMEARVAVLEQIAKTTSEALTGIRSDMRGQRDEQRADQKGLRDDISDLRKTQDRDFRLTVGITITTAIGLATLLAKGFHWL